MLIVFKGHQLNWIERDASDVEVVGSSPTWPTKKTILQY